MTCTACAGVVAVQETKNTLRRMQIRMREDDKRIMEDDVIPIPDLMMEEEEDLRGKGGKLGLLEWDTYVRMLGCCLVTLTRTWTVWSVFTGAAVFGSMTGGPDSEVCTFVHWACVFVLLSMGIRTSRSQTASSPPFLHTDVIEVEEEAIWQCKTNSRLAYL